MQQLWKRAARARDVVKAKANRGAKARLALADLLWKAGHPVSLVTIHTWPRHVQGEAYLWARAFVDGREDLAAPAFVQEAGARDGAQRLVYAGARR